MYRVKTMSDVRDANARAGFYFFSPSTMSFFSSCVESDLLPGNRFITSEKRCFDDDTRRYTVREFDPDTAHIKTVGEFCQYETFAEAMEAAKL